MTNTDSIAVWCGAVALCAGAFLAAASSMTAQATAAMEKPATVEALFVSDIHFEPFWDPAKAARLPAVPAAQWDEILSAPASADQPKRSRPCSRVAGHARLTPLIRYSHRVFKRFTTMPAGQSLSC